MAPRDPGIGDADLGWRLVAQGAYLDANEAFVRAARQAPDEARTLVGLGYSYMLLADYHRAAAALERAIALDVKVGLAHGLLGDLYQRQGDLERAIHHFRIARDQDPSDVAIRSRLLMVRGRYRAEAGLDRIYSAHFVVKYRAGTLPPRSVHETVDRLEQVYRSVGGWFKFFPAEPVTVMLYPAEKFRRATGSPEWARGLFDGAIHLPVSAGQAQDETWVRVLRHEYTHALVDRMSAGRAPVWLSEGLALYMEGPQDILDSPNAAQPSVGDDKLYLLHSDYLVLSPERAGRVYRQSLQATKRLIEQHGTGGIRDLLKALATTNHFPAAYEAAFQVPFHGVEGRRAHRPVTPRF